MEHFIPGLHHRLTRRAAAAARAVAAACAVILLLATAACSGAAPKASPPAHLDKITIGMDSTAVNTLILIAQDQNYFAANGLSVTVKNYPSGLAAVNDMLDHHAMDVATASEFVLVGKALVGQKVSAWGSIDKFIHNYLIARKDHGINTVADLQGKTIGVPFKTVAEFYLRRFLELHELDLSKIKVVNVDPTDLVQALTSGTVDAVTAWQPNAKSLEDRLGSGTVRWSVQNEQVAYAVVLSAPEWVNAHPDQVRSFLKALAEAEAWYAGHPNETKALLKERLAYDDSYIAAIWPEHQFQLSFDQSLILAMEDESRWMIRNQLTSAAEPPAFLDYLYLDGIQAVKPSAVNIIQ